MRNDVKKERKERKVSIEQLLIEKDLRTFMTYKYRNDIARFFFSHGLVVIIFTILIAFICHNGSRGRETPHNEENKDPETNKVNQCISDQGEKNLSVDILNIYEGSNNGWRNESKTKNVLRRGEIKQSQCNMRK